MFLHTDSEDSDQTGRMPRLILVFAGRIGHFVGFVKPRLKFNDKLLLKYIGILRLINNFGQILFHK